nr:hypothetical protein [Tanacetum cinerariifolium]
MDFEKEEKKSVEPQIKDQKGKRIKIVADSAPKQKSSKKQKMMQEPELAKSDEEESIDYEQENEELRMCSTRLEVSAPTPSTPPTTTTIFGDEDLTIAQTLIKMKSKGVLVEEEPEKLQKVKRRNQGLAQIESDANLAQRIYEKELAELERAQNERQKQEETIIATLTKEFDEIQARMDVYHELVIRMTHKEKEMARLLAEYFERRKKQLAAERAEAIRNKPHTRTQVRNMMITYLKHIDLEKEEKKSVVPESKDQKGKRIKIVADSAPKQKSSKKQKMMQEPESAKSDEEESVDYEQENEELRMWLTFVLDEKETVDPEFFSTKLVMKRCEENTLESYNLLLWGDLKVMFEPNAEDKIWSNQQDWNLISWKSYENCGIHTLLMDGTSNYFNMLVEK